MNIKLLQDKILEEFWGIRNNDSGEFVNNFIPRPGLLYHYTTIDAALAILDEASGFAFTDCRFLNDEKEFFGGVEVVLEALGKSAGGAFPDWMLAQISAKIRMKTERHRYIPYVLSFSTSGDSTPHWMIYADKKKGGVAIGLNFGKIEKLIKQSLVVFTEAGGKKLKLGNALFAPCVYYKRDQMDYGFRKRIASLTDIAFAGLWSAKLEEHDQFVDWCASKVCQLAALMKTDDFIFEREWRMVIHPTNEEFASGIRFITNKPRIIPSELPLISCATCGIVSPNGDRKRNRLALELAAKHRGIKVNFTTSRSSYVG